MTKQLSTKLYKLNFRELIDNATNRAYWTKKWEIFQYDGISITFILDYIDITGNKLIGKLALNGKENRGYFRNPYTLITIPLEKYNYNELALNKELVGKVDSLFSEQGERDLKETDEYLKLKEIEDDFNDRLKEIASDFLDSNNVYNKDIREAYIDSYVDNNSKSYGWDYVNENRNTMYIPSRVTFAIIMDYNDKADWLIKLSEMSDSEQLIKEAEELKLQLEEGNLEEFEDRLEDI